MRTLTLRDVAFPRVTFDPLSMSPTGWWQFADASAVTLNTTTISQINDKSGGGNHLTQGTALNQPTYNVGGLNGRNYAQYAGGQQLRISSFSAASGSTLFVVGRCSTLPTVGQSQILAQSVGGTAPSLYVPFSGSAKFGVYLGVDAGNTPAADTAWHVFTVKFSGGSTTLRINGVDQGITTGGMSGGAFSGIFALGASANVTPTQFLTGGIAEALVAPAVSDANRNAYESSLISYYGL